MCTQGRSYVEARRGSYLLFFWPFEKNACRNIASFTEFTEFTEASSIADTAGMSRHRLAPYTVHYLKTLLILAVSGS